MMDVDPHYWDEGVTCSACHGTFGGGVKKANGQWYCHYCKFGIEGPEVDKRPVSASCDFCTKKVKIYKYVKNDEAFYICNDCINEEFKNAGPTSDTDSSQTN